MDSEGERSFVVLVGLVIAVAGMLANGFVVAAISGDKMMRGNSMYLLLANLVSASTHFWRQNRNFFLGNCVVNHAWVSCHDRDFQAVADLLYLFGSVVTTAFVKYNGVYLRAFGSYVLQLAIFASICTNVSVYIERYARREGCGERSLTAQSWSPTKTDRMETERTLLPGINISLDRAYWVKEALPLKYRLEIL